MNTSWELVLINFPQPGSFHGQGHNTKIKLKDFKDAMFYNPMWLWVTISILKMMTLIQGYNWGQTFQGQGQSTKYKGQVYLKDAFFPNFMW